MTYTPAFLKALSERCALNAARCDASAEKAHTRFTAENCRRKAHDYRSLMWDALAARDGCEASLDSLNEYFATDIYGLEAECLSERRAA